LKFSEKRTVEAFENGTDMIADVIIKARRDNAVMLLLFRILILAS
jgi:hypothetical protein